MGHAGRQFQALFWKNWLCRLRHPVLSLAEFFWPCILFMILTILRLQEPPRHRDTCFLQPRDLPSRGVFPFVQGLLCNTGSRCRNFTFDGSMDHRFQLSRFQSTAGPAEVNSLAFVKEVQDLAEGIYETMDKAKRLQRLWEERSKTSDSSYGSSFLTMDLNKTEEVILKLESFHQQPHIWDFLLSLPSLHASNLHVQDVMPVLVPFLQTVLNSLTSLEDLDQLPLNQAFFQGSEVVLNVTISTLEFLQQHGAADTESVYHLSLQSMVWEPQKVKSDLKSQFGFDALQIEQILNYSIELKEIPTNSSLERMVCSILSSISEDEAETEGRDGPCHPRWSEAKDYLIGAVGWLRLYKQIFDQWQRGGLPQKMLVGARHSLEALRDQFEEGSEPWKVAEAVHTGLLLLNDSLTDDGLGASHLAPQISEQLQKLQSILQSLPQWPALKRLLQLISALRNAVAQDLHFVQEILTHLETSVNTSLQGLPEGWNLDKDVFFEGLKQMFRMNATATCLNRPLSEKDAPLPLGNSSIPGDFWGLLCNHTSVNETHVLKKLLGSVEETDHILQEVITGHTTMPVSVPELYLDWKELQKWLSEVSFSCSRLFQSQDEEASCGNCDSFDECQHQLLSIVTFHMLETAQLSLKQASTRRDFLGFVRKICEVASVNVQGFQSSLSAFSEDFPCYSESMDWKIISENYFSVFNNLWKSPATFISRVLNFTKYLLAMEKKSHNLGEKQMNFLLSFVDFLERLLLPNPLGSASAPKSHTLSSFTEKILNKSALWIHGMKSLEKDPPATDVQKLLEFGKEVIERAQSLESQWMKKQSKNILRSMELILLEINPELLELWLYGISKEERDKLEILSTLLNFSVPEDEKIFNKSLNFSHLFPSDWLQPPAVNMDFVHLSETVINSLHEFGFLRQDQVSEALKKVYTIKNASDLFSVLSEPQKQDIDKIFTHIYLSVFKDNDSTLLLKIYLSIYQFMYEALSIQSRDSLLTYLTQVTRHILDIIKQFNFQTISQAFAFLSETARILEGISEVSYCQQLFSIFNFLELQAQSLTSTEDPVLEVIHITLIGLKQLFLVDGDFRISLFQYISQLFNGSAEVLLGNECSVLDNEIISSVSYLKDEVSSFSLPWARIFSNLSTNVSVFNEFLAVHCTVSWLQMWTEILGNISQILKFDLNTFTPLHAGLTQLLDEFEHDVKISQSCRGVFPTQHAARLILNLFKNVTQADDFQGWHDFLDLRDLWVTLGDALVTVRSLNLSQVEKSLATLQTALHQLNTFPINMNVSREFLYSVLEVFIALSHDSTSRNNNVDLINHFSLKNLTDNGAKVEIVITDLRETILFLRNVSHDKNVLSCADVFQNVTELILEEGLLSVNTSQGVVHLLAILNSTLSSENTINRLKGCHVWVDIIKYLYVKYNSSFSHGHLHGILRSFKDMENKINSTLKVITWVLNMKKPLCFLNQSNINCVNIYLKDITDFLNIILTTVFEKENMPKFEILLSFLNDSTNKVRMIISNLTKDFDFASQSNWEYFTELVLRPTEMLEKTPSQFQNIWLHLISLGKEIQKLVKDISLNILKNTSYSETENIFRIFTTSSKENNINHIGNSIYRLANYLAFNLSQALQNSEIIPHEIMKIMSLSIQLMRDVFNSLMPTVYHNIPQNTGHVQVLKKVTSFIRTFKKEDIDLLVDQLEQISESLVGFFKNLSRLDKGNLGVNLLVGLMEKFVDSSHSWDVSHLLRISRLFPKDTSNALVDVYYALPYVTRLLQRVADKNITDGLKDVYNFTLHHGISISYVTKEDFAIVIKTLLEAVELVSYEPATISEALICLPTVWCWNHTMSRFQQNAKLEACNVHGRLSSSFFRKVVRIINHLHLPLLVEDSQCSNESLQMEITRKAVCVIHELVDWNSILLELLEVFHINTSLVKSVQEFGHKILAFTPPSGYQYNDSKVVLCPEVPLKQAVLQIVETLKNVSLTKVSSGENIFGKLTSLNKILNITKVTETFVQNNVSLNLERIIKFISRDWSLQNSTHYLLFPLMILHNKNITDSSLKALLSLIKKSEAIYNFQQLWVDFKQNVEDLTYDFNMRNLFSEIKKEIQSINSVELQSTVLQLSHFLEILDSSLLKILENIEDLLSVTKKWLHELTKEEYSRLIKTLFVPLASENLTGDITKDIATYLSYLKSTSREGHFDTDFLTHLLHQEELANFSAIQLLFESILMNSTNTSGSSQESVLNLSNTYLQIINFINLTWNHMESQNGGKTILSPRGIVNFMKQLLNTSFSLFLEKNSRSNISLLLKDFHKDVIAEMSVVELCQVFQQLEKPSEAIKMLQKLTMIVSHAIIIFADALQGPASSLEKGTSDGNEHTRCFLRKQKQKRQILELEVMSAVCRWTWQVFERLQELTGHRALGLGGADWHGFRSACEYASVRQCTQAIPDLAGGENPSLTKDILCAALSCDQVGIRSLILSAMQGVTLAHHHFQDMEEIWSSPNQLNCESLSKNLSSALESFQRNLEIATAQDCTCLPSLETAQWSIHMLAQSLEETWLSRNSFMIFLSNFTVTENVKVKDLMTNITKLAEELRSSIHLSEETIHSILEASIPHTQVLSSALAVALSGKCDSEILHLLLIFPKDGNSWFAVKELCGLQGSEVYHLIMVMGQNLNLRNFIYKTLIPSEANDLLNSLLDVISSLSSLLTRAQHVFKNLPEFFHTFKITAFLDMPDFQQVLQGGQVRSSAFGSFQTVMKLVCKDQASFLSNSNMFINLPRVNELLEDDKEKFSIPQDSTPFCLKLYQEILQSPNGALVWSFLKPILHGKILYTPNTPEINKVIQKANYTFHFVDKLKILSETLLKMFSLFQGSGNGQMFNQLQEVMKNKFIRKFVESQLHIDVDKLIENLQTYGVMLDKMLNHTGAGHVHFLGHILVNLSSCVVLDRFQAVQSVDTLETRARELMQQNNLLASIIFNSSLVGKRVRTTPKLPPHVTYTIRTSVLYSMRTDLIKNPSWKFHPQSLPADGFKYNYIFVPLQDMIERAIIMVQTGQEALEPTTQTQATPYPCHTSDLFLNNVGFFFPLIMMLTWMVSVASMVRKLVYEREVQIEEYMRMMGVHPTIHFLAWFLENMAVLTLSSAALAILLKISGIFAHSNAVIIFLFFLNFGVSVVMLSYCLSAFFSQANMAALCTSLAYMISFLPYIILLVLHNQLSFAIQTFLCFLSTTAIGQGVFFITFLEGQEAGIQWNNMYQAPEQGSMTFGWVCWMILFDSSLYFLCGWYFSNLVPGTFGLKKPWYFPFTMSYWKSVCGFLEKQKQSLSSTLFFFNKNFSNKESSQQNREGEPEGSSPGAVLVSVTKEYQGSKVAVQDLTLSFHRGQITALLGTNGAGKTTIISMLTGLYPPSSGTIIVNGKNLQTDLSRVRAEMGVCPQQDVLLANLTVREHLLLFASIKAPWWTKKELQQQVDKTLEDVGLTQHQHKQTWALSGGMKRKLSIGIAFLGMSKTVVLDEPTSGVDPCSRRNLWDILLKYREGRTIIFTTHHLDEAEMLSDHVAVLQQGRLRCCGPPFCLKEAYGRGLSLTLTKQPSVLEGHNPKDIARVTALIQVYIPQAFLKDNSGSELTFTIPKDADKACFKGLFQALDQNLQQLHLMGYGISDTTLEEVFLMLLQDSSKKSHFAPGMELEPQNQRAAGPSPGYCAPEQTPLTTMHGYQLIRAQVAALLRKRLQRTVRAWKSTISDLLLPVLFVALAMGLFMVRPLATKYPPLRLMPGHYGRMESYFFSSRRDSMNLSHVLLRKFGDTDLLCAGVNSDLKNSSCWQRDSFSRAEFQDSCGCLKCPNGSSGAPYLTNHLGHTLLNLSGYNVEEYLLVPSEKPRLGGWSFGVQNPSGVPDMNANTSKPRTLAKVWYNQKGFHSLPSYLNHLNNLILWRHLPPAVNWRQYGITLYSHPYGGALLNEDKILESIRQCGVALCIVLGFSILSASIGSSVVRDRVTGAKRLQHISGLGYRTYWVTHFLYDMLFYLFSVCLCVAIIVAFQLTAFTFRENLAATALLLALFGYAILPWMYLTSGIFSSSDVAFISYISLNFIFGLCTMLMTTMPRLLAIISKAQNLQNIHDILKWVFTIFPQFCLGQGLIELCYNQIKYDLTHNFGIDSYASPFEMNFLGWIFVELALQGTVLLLLRILLHRELLRGSRGHTALQGTVKSFKDIDVEKEKVRVSEGRTSGDILMLHNLSKCYRTFLKKTPAVQDINVGIPRGECFGLLGVNGAGKTSTFMMLSGEVPPSAGHAIVRTPTGGEVDLSSAGEAGIFIGYCPQQDALDELLTGWEHLQYYCSLRGIPKHCIPEVSGELVRRLHLEAHAGKPVATYSGGTKRKLSTALALVGKPDILLLDEPSSGMDPCSKRYLWQTITKEVQEGCAAVLTSHSMEECEALCTRLAIMVDGNFQCLGSPQHIRNRFGDGYTVKVWLSKEANQPSTISDCLKLHFPGIQFKGQRLNLLEYHVPKRWGCLADLFKVLESNKEFLHIQHYSINQTTLEQVFINFATKQQQTPRSSLDPSNDRYHPYYLTV